ncbi:thioredoxin family protein [Geothrix sp. PMB-07]|uniref:thioredoxin family protein n=1 Tax=Geothrix sp. PMB-07 TaxID=3068640 RepID=UPI00274128C6|nr:thioredoxin family protein [Geothrix sp. PMB-07]WLT30435.1 thioredoxin family protein [Geothrix sp. PMB-07]
MQWKSAALMACLSFLPAWAQTPIKGEAEYRTALARAQAEGKPLFVFLWTAYSQQCLYVQKEVLPSPDAQAALAGFIPISVQLHTETKLEIRENRLLARRWNLSVFPTFLILDRDGRELKRREEILHTGSDLADWVK